jgi:hypothetical protein
MNAETIDRLMVVAADNLRELGAEMTEHILEAAAAALEEASDDADAKPKLKIGFAITVPLDDAAPEADFKLSVGIRRTAQTSERLPDESQPELPELAKKRGGAK